MNAVVRARVDEAVKEEATAVLAGMGLTVSDAMRLMLVRIARDKAFPFDLNTPNAETRAAMQEARDMAQARFASADALMADLDAAQG